MKKDKIYYDPIFIASYLLTIIFSLHGAEFYHNGEKNIMKIAEKVIDKFTHNPMDLHFTFYNIRFMLAMVLFLTIFWIYLIVSEKNYRKGIEYGSAKWAKRSDGKKLMDKDDKNNIILTNTEKLSLDTRKTRKNLNIMVVGGSGSGKTRFFCKPSLMQLNTSFVITDPKAELLKSTGNMLEGAGYEIKVLNLIEMDHSNCYNPFSYIREDKDILKMINILMKNTTPVGQKSSDSFWEKSETALLQALVYFLYYEAPESEQNFEMIMELLRSAKVKEEDEDYESDLDILFKNLELKSPNHIAVKQYQIFKQAAGKTAKSILISLGVRLAVFNTDSVRRLTITDNIDLGSVGDKKTAMFIVIPDNDDTYNFIAAMVYAQLFDTLYYKADFMNNKRLPVHVRFIMDEFSNIGQIPDFEKVIATIRSREISVSIILQNLAQLKSLYDKKWEIISGNCDSALLLGCTELSTLEYFSKLLGKETIDFTTYTRSKGKNSGSSINENMRGRDLMTPDEIAKMPDSKCLLLVKGLKPFYSDKYKIEKHPNYSKISDNEENQYDLRKIKTYVDVFEEKELVFDSDDIDDIEYAVEYEDDEAS